MLTARLRLASLVGAALFVAACTSQDPPSSSPVLPVPASRQATDAFIVAPDLPPLSAVGVANTQSLIGRSPEVVRAVHEFAARHPEVLNYVPCFCGCERSGHMHNEDCFVGARDAQGKVTSWDNHGLT